MKKKVISLFIAMTMALSFNVSVYADKTPPPATRGEIVNSLLTAADAYNPKINKEAIIKGHKDGNLKENEPVKKVEALVMLSRAFGELPEPVGNDLRTRTFDVAFTDVPPWAKKDIDKLIKAGILTAKPDGSLGAYDPITNAEFQTIITRVWALKGSHVNDDFYETINKQWLNKSVIPEGEVMNEVFFELRQQNKDEIVKIIDDLAVKTFAEGTEEQKLIDFYASALDTESRNKQGVQPIQKYLKAIDEAKTLDKLVLADLAMENEIGLSLLFSFTVMGDAKNSTKNALYHIGLTMGLDKTSFVTENVKTKAAYIQYMTKLLILTGEERAAAKARAEKVYTMEKSLAAVSLDLHEMGNVDHYYNPLTIEQFDDLHKEIDMKQVLKSLKLDSVEKVISSDVKRAQKGAEWMTEANLDVLKAYSKVRLLATTAHLLSKPFDDATNEFNAVLYGIVGKKTDRENAITLTRSTMRGFIEQTYVEKHFSSEAKKDVEQMVDKLIDTYEKRIKTLDWMSEPTKAKAIKKLDTMIVKIGYPDKWDTTLNKVTIKNYEKGGSLFSNTYAVNKANVDSMKAKLGKPVDRTEWSVPAYAVNAYFDPFNNEIIFPAGILQAPFYDTKAKPEANLGAIGMVIGHEISHAFDNNGAAFDEHGNAKNWWTDEDFKKFKEKNQALIEFYNGVEIIPGVLNDGQLTLGENIADLGGMAASLQVVSEMSNPDYKAYFESNAKMWRFTTTKEYAIFSSTAVSQSDSKIRTNRTIVNFQEFYDTYGIKPGDGMYVAPGDRVSIW
ncbi:M13-type metalloendopeptidase [Paenibacillus agilis]|uniref:Peptidase n=1 Tax=Paenibacillus agilis TaxID=3020863 RepID=A0A559IQ40_9BACL|nr:M13-type metalloendopeptidase [Paenibacillus agilis]TVX89755.1 peptidase [Paenibacillus agilis]